MTVEFEDLLVPFHLSTKAPGYFYWTTNSVNSTKYLQQQIETEFLLWQLSWIMSWNTDRRRAYVLLYMWQALFFFPPVSLLPAGLHCGMSPLKSRLCTLSRISFNLVLWHVTAIFIFSLTAFYFNITVSFKLKWEQSYKMRANYTIAAEKTNSISWMCVHRNAAREHGILIVIIILLENGTSW